MSHYDIEFINSLPKYIDEKMNKGHIDYETTHGISCNYKKFSLLIKIDKNKTIGVLSAYAAFAEIYVDDLWVDCSYRKQGYGRKLLEVLEDHFNGQGYNNINLITSQFQAPEFYKKCGFKIEFIRHNKHNPKLSKTFFIKYFDDEMQTQGVLARK